MKKGKTILILMLVGIIIVGVVVGIFIMKKRTDDPLANTKIIYVETYDAQTEEKIKTNFIVVINKTIVAEGTTNLKGLEEVAVPIIENENIYILGFSDIYYVQMGLFLDNPFSLDLYKKGEIKLIDVSTNTKKVNFTIKAENGQYRQLGFCVGWSYSFLGVWNNDYLQGEYMNTREKCEGMGLKWQQINDTYTKCELGIINVFPSRLKNIVDRCYYTLHSLNEDENMTLTLSYDTIQELGEYDELEIIFFDSDRNYLNKYSIEDMEGNDIGEEDYKFILDSDCLKTGICNLESCKGDYCSI